MIEINSIITRQVTSQSQTKNTITSHIFLFLWEALYVMNIIILPQSSQREVLFCKQTDDSTRGPNLQEMEQKSPGRRTGLEDRDKTENYWQNLSNVMLEHQTGWRHDNTTPGWPRPGPTTAIIFASIQRLESNAISNIPLIDDILTRKIQYLKPSEKSTQKNDSILHVLEEFIDHMVEWICMWNSHLQWKVKVIIQRSWSACCRIWKLRAPYLHTCGTRLKATGIHRTKKNWNIHWKRIGLRIHHHFTRKLKSTSPGV